MNKFINFEWMRIPIDYLKVSTNKDKVTELVLPIIVATITTYIYHNASNTELALSRFNEILVNIVSILIGFTGVLLTLLLTANNKTINILKSVNSNKKLYGKEVSLFDVLHIIFSATLLNEIFLIIIVMLYYFFLGIVSSTILNNMILWSETALFLTIIFSTIRGITNLYWSFKA